MSAFELRPGLKHGLPAWHTVAGTGVPVVSPELWVAPKQGGQALDDDSTGAVQPLWIKLIDPVTSSPFWFHRRFRSRRDEAPAADDDGSIGAWTGEPEAKRFVRCLDGPTKHAYYVDLAAVTTSWVRPAEFDSVGISLPSAVGAPEHPDALAATPHFPVELLVGRTFRDGTWWAEKRGGGKHFYSSTAFRKRLLVTRAGALSYFKSEAEAARAMASNAKGVQLSQYFVIHSWCHAQVTLLPFIELTATRAAATGVQATRQFALRFESGELADEAALAMGWLPPPMSMLKVEVPAPSVKLPLTRWSSSESMDREGEVSHTDVAAAAATSAADAADGVAPAEALEPARQAVGCDDTVVLAASTEPSAAAPKPPPLHLMPRKPAKPSKRPAGSTGAARGTP